MPSSSDSADQKLSMTRENRHQYVETAMVSASESEREMMRAEARGRERRLQEIVWKRKLQNWGMGLLTLLVILVVASAVMWLSTQR